KTGRKTGKINRAAILRVLEKLLRTQRLRTTSHRNIALTASPENDWANYAAGIARPMRANRRVWIDAYGSTHGAGKATPIMTTDSVPVDRMASPLEQADALLWARVALMSELEASLHGSRKALLALDLPGIEHGTNEQAGLI